MADISLRRNLSYLLIGVSLGGGFILTLLSLLFPYMLVEITWMRYVVWLWLATVAGLFFWLMKRILGSDPVPGERHRLASGWDHRVERRKKISYSNDVLSQQARYAQAKAARDAAERQGVEVQFKNTDSADRD